MDLLAERGFVGILTFVAIVDGSVLDGFPCQSRLNDPAQDEVSQNSRNFPPSWASFVCPCSASLMIYYSPFQILDVKNVVVVVSRWFGGILLGGDRFKLINNAARDALELGSYVTKSGSQNADNKKKSKKK